MAKLGIDIGTTSVKVCVVASGVVRLTSKKDHAAYCKATDFVHRHGHLFREQKVQLILDALGFCLAEICESGRVQDVVSIHVTGQMHGVILWTQPSTTAIKQISMVSLKDTGIVTSNLVTWEDKRCDVEFLKKFSSSLKQPFHSGYGCATLAWMAEEYGADVMRTYQHSGTIMDFVVWLFTGCREKVVMSPQNAASWGCFDVELGAWHTEDLRCLAVPAELLPAILPCGTEVGVLAHSIYGISERVKVYVALGDMQCAIKSCQPSIFDAVLNIGTSSQLSVLLPRHGDVSHYLQRYPALTMVPYSHDQNILTAASLTGGNVILDFLSTIQSWNADLGLTRSPLHDLFQSFHRLADLKLSESQDEPAQNVPKIIPTLYGERHNAQASACVLNLTRESVSFSTLSVALLQGIVDNLASMMPASLLQALGVTRILGAGSVLHESGAIRKLISKTFGIPLALTGDGDAAYGATLT